MPIDVTILMPCLNEAKTLPVCIDWARAALDELAQQGLTGEILIADNGSDDGSVELARARGCRVVHVPQRGYGAALIHGGWAAAGRCIIMGDSDASYDFREAVPMIAKLQEGFDLCMGNRFMGGIRPGAMPWKNRYLGNPVLTAVLNLFYRSGIHDAHCGLRAFTRDAFAKMRLNSPGMEFASEMVVKAALLGLRATEVPVTLHPDQRDRAPHLRPWRDGWRHLKYLLLLSPHWLYMLPAKVMVILAAVIFGVLLATPRGQVFRFGPFWLGDHWMILAGGLFTFGCTGLLFGHIALAFAIQRGYRRPPHLTPWLLRPLPTEAGLILGGLLAVAGLALLAWVVGVWVKLDNAELNRTREMVLATALILSGLQITFGSFLLALINERTVRPGLAASEEK